MRKTDPAIDAVRAVRRQISARYGHDPKRLIAHYREAQRKYGDRLLPQPCKQHADA